jgi:hypothetical protein
VGDGGELAVEILSKGQKTVALLFQRDTDGTDAVWCQTNFRLTLFSRARALSGWARAIASTASSHRRPGSICAAADERDSTEGAGLPIMAVAMSVLSASAALTN